MQDLDVQRLEEIEAYSGPHAIPGIEFRPAGKALGVKAWGMNVLSIEPGCTGYPKHDHAKDGQEEVYVVLRGGGTLEAAGEQLALEQGTLARVGPALERTIHPGPEGIVLLALGGTPGKPYPTGL